MKILNYCVDEQIDVQFGQVINSVLVVLEKGVPLTTFYQREKVTQLQKLVHSEQLLTLIDILHHQQIAHLDLKPTEFIIHNNLLKLSGFSRIKPRLLSHQLREKSFNFEQFLSNQKYCKVHNPFFDLDWANP